MNIKHNSAQHDGGGGGGEGFKFACCNLEFSKFAFDIRKFDSEGEGEGGRGRRKKGEEGLVIPLNPLAVIWRYPSSRPPSSPP